jgi:hypothetical protein
MALSRGQRNGQAHGHNDSVNGVLGKVVHEYRPNAGKLDPGAAGAICLQAHDDPVHERCVEVFGKDAAQGRKVDGTCMERGGFHFGSFGVSPGLNGRQLKFHFARHWLAGFCDGRTAPGTPAAAR